MNNPKPAGPVMAPGNIPTTSFHTMKHLRSRFLNHGLARVVALLAAATQWVQVTCGALPEPDTLIWGIINLGGTNLSPSQNVVVQARRIPMGASVSETRLGDVDPSRYSLRIPIDSGLPLLRDNASVPGNILYLTVIVGGQVRSQVAYTVEGKGIVRRIDFGDVDTDADGLPDGWEQANLLDTRFGASDDPDGDGLVNADEFRLGTNPSKMDAPHPADVSPRDNRITISELSDYYNAWRTTNTWMLSPTNIPIEYVTRATFIWEGGEYYRQETNVAMGGSSTAPLWWIKATAPVASSSTEPRDALAGKSKLNAGISQAPLQVLAIFPDTFAPGDPAAVRYQALPSSGMRTYALEDVPPVGWKVTAVSEGGTYDAVNRKVKWGPYFDRKPRNVGYTVVPDRVVAGQKFVGLGSYDGLLVPVTGRRTAVEDPSYLAARVVLDSHPAGWFVAGSPGARYRVEHSQNLREWSVLTNGSADGEGRFFFGPALPASSAVNFVRAKELGNDSGIPVTPMAGSPSQASP